MHFINSWWIMQLLSGVDTRGLKVIWMPNVIEILVSQTPCTPRTARPTSSSLWPSTVSESTLRRPTMLILLCRHNRALNPWLRSFWEDGKTLRVRFVSMTRGPTRLKLTLLLSSRRMRPRHSSWHGLRMDKLPSASRELLRHSSPGRMINRTRSDTSECERHGVQQEIGRLMVHTFSFNSMLFV